jgi:hypothetical protein
MTHARSLGLRYRVVIDIDDAVQDVSDHFRYVMEFGGIAFAIRDERGQGDRGEIAHSYLLGRWILDDFRAEVGWLDSTEVFLGIQ